MSAPLSVIIPTLNTSKTLGPTLACVYQGVSNSLVREVIFADGGSSDDIAELADELGAELISSPAGRGTQLRKAADQACGTWLLFLHADTVLSPNWVQAFGAHINSSDKAAYCNLAFNHTGFMAGFVAAWANFRSRVFGLPYGDQALLISRKHYNATGGYRDIALMEDVAIARKIGRHKTALSVTATTNANSYIQMGWLKRGGQNLMTLALYFLGRDPDKLAKRYTP